MILKKGKPPVYERIITAGLQPRDTTVFTYGETLYIQDLDENRIDPILRAHEEVHVRQQGDNVEEWWNKYLADPAFRFEQELEAYGTQFRFIKQLRYNDKFNKWVLHNLASDLCSPMYGTSLTISEAESKIRNKAKDESNTQTGGGDKE